MFDFFDMIEEKIKALSRYDIDDHIIIGNRLYLLLMNKIPLLRVTKQLCDRMDPKVY